VGGQKRRELEKYPEGAWAGNHSSPQDRSDASLLDRSGIYLESPQLQLLWSYHQLLREYNAQLTLHAFTTSSYVLKLYVDSILPAQIGSAVTVAGSRSGPECRGSAQIVRPISPCGWPKAVKTG